MQAELIKQETVSKSDLPLSFKGMSHKLWGLNWEEHLPAQVGRPKVTVESVPYSMFKQFAEQNYHDIYQNDRDRFAASQMAANLNSTKELYYESMGDFFLFRDGEECVGSYAATVLDWSTYYLRSSGLKNSHRGRGIYKQFTELLVETLAAYPGIERLFAEVSPANLPVLNVLNRNGFYIVGTLNSERWGTLVQLVKYLQGNQKKKFLESFCGGLHPELARR